MNCVFVYVICIPTPLAIDVGTGLGISAYEVSSCLKECTFCSEYTVSLLVEERVFFRVIAFRCCLCSHIVKNFKFDTHTHTTDELVSWDIVYLYEITYWWVQMTVKNLKRIFLAKLVSALKKRLQCIFY